MTPSGAAGIVVFGVLTGLLSALFGVGGGIAMVPFMTFALGLSQHTAEGTSLVVIVPTAVAGVLAHRRLQSVGLRIPVLLAAGGMFGSFVGASLALGIEGDLLQQLFGALVILAGLRLVWSGVVSIRQRRSEFRLDG